MIDRLAEIELAGNAVITTRQRSAYAVLVQTPEMPWPPAYFTPDWDAVRTSVCALAGLEPQTILAGHGTPIADSKMRAALHRLVHDFDAVAGPPGGCYITQPARPGTGGT